MLRTPDIILIIFYQLQRKKFDSKFKSALLRFSSIQRQFEKTPQPIGDRKIAVEPPEHDEEDKGWLDVPSEEIPHVDGPFKLGTFAIITHPRITAVLSQLTDAAEGGPKKKARLEEPKKEHEATTEAASDNTFNFSYD